MKILIFILLLTIPGTAQALNSEQFRPNFDHLGLVNLLEHRALQKRAWSLGMGLSYARRPMEFGVVSSGARISPLIDHQVNTTLSGAYGIADWVSIGLSIPFFPTLEVQPIGAAATESTAAFGDIGIIGKFLLWEKGDPQKDDASTGYALSPFLTFPSGSSAKFVGNTSVTGGLQGAWDISFWKNKIVTNLGLRFREKETLLNLSVGQELLYGIGYTRPIVQNWDLHGLTEITGSATLYNFGRANQSPLEWFFGLKKGFREGRLNLTAGSALGITNGYGTPGWRVFGMASYSAPPIPSLKPVAPTMIEKTASTPGYAKIEGGQIVILQPIHFETGRWIIKKESLPVVKDVADLMIGQPHIRRVLIVGHTDSRGSDRYNLKLSKNRAWAVRKKLIEYGVAADRRFSVGRGELQPIVPNQTAAGRAKNRRVEFLIVEILSAP